ncbi:hypothetical protein BKA80DRAFT_258209 [Phyllosticta citrichinensis]
MYEVPEGQKARVLHGASPEEKQLTESEFYIGRSCERTCAYDYVESRFRCQIGCLSKKINTRDNVDKASIPYEYHIELLQRVLSIDPYIMPKDNDLTSPKLHHPAFSLDNIYVDEDFRVKTVIGWRSSWVGPAFASLSWALQLAPDEIKPPLLRLTFDLTKTFLSRRSMSSPAPAQEDCFFAYLSFCRLCNQGKDYKTFYDFAAIRGIAEHKVDYYCLPIEEGGVEEMASGNFYRSFRLKGRLPWDSPFEGFSSTRVMKLTHLSFKKSRLVDQIVNSEASTVQFALKLLDLAVPMIWMSSSPGYLESDAGEPGDEALPAMQFIFMNAVEGTSLRQAWEGMDLKAQVTALTEIFEFEQKLASHHFKSLVNPSFASFEPALMLKAGMDLSALIKITSSTSIHCKSLSQGLGELGPVPLSMWE